MDAVEGLDDDRDTALPSSALSPAEYRSFRGMVTVLVGVNGGASFTSVVEFLMTFNGVNHGVAQQVGSLCERGVNGQIVDVVVGSEEEFLGEGHIYAMIRLVGHWQSEGRISKSMIFVQGMFPSLNTVVDS